jgi:hypothetical protein
MSWPIALTVRVTSAEFASIVEAATARGGARTHLDLVGNPAD